ncbi:TPA: DUF2845 domain-containing protein [Vibrio cholerae]|uniref:DUF2845 domain-containing protein n=1 Tax=Vibrio TaxID=662 RepID=UPI00115B494C|nr:MULTISPECIES: DUF2845 domain-containing protein [Vibrio]QIL87057.1 DUF2845 domain-containing protein [Vibrio sp. HDW18]TQP44550.1 DUF2845 domain-containing protein [Vibrio cholerae]TQP68709.1 DUF2845 domain-containing protein [Vibrio cholerae]TQP80486.1 DUF2845 domain-containing protein [Vibrio cholerae]TQQ02018.1 DUF2845 domain-containing protein [Vibrio cholerae]
MELLVWFLVFVVVIIVISGYLDKKKRQRLMAKYGNAELVDRLMKKTIWEGQTEEQLIDSLGKPLDIDQKVLKTKVKETWKYDKAGKNRYNLRIIVENGSVVGWDKK